MVSVSTLIWATQSFADTTISTAVTAPVATSTAAAGAPDNVVIGADGSVKPGAGTAITLDSNNTVTNSGAIMIQDASDATGLLVLGGRTGAVTNSATIEVDETTVFTDTDGDGDLDGPFATGARRFGVRVVGPGAFTGNISNAAGGVITVQGDDSTGVSIETDLAGTLSNVGAITVRGSRSYGLRAMGSVAGDVSVTGSIGATGAAAQAMVLQGDVAGGVIVQGAVYATGYRTTVRSTVATELAALDADDLLQGGPALAISGNVARGLLIDAPPVDTNVDNTDEDADGIDDSLEGTGSVASYGAAPAVVIGAVGRDVALGDVGTGDNAYGVVIRGSVSGSGVYDGVSATGLQLGVAGGGAVTTGGGVRIFGSVGASAYEADATAIRLNPGASVPVLHNDGSIAASVIAEGLARAGGVVIEAGANAPVLQNAGAIAASVSGEKGDAVAILDRSGSLSTIQNVGAIGAAVIATDDVNDTDDADTSAANEVVTGKAVAIDVSQNVTGVSLLQWDVSAGLTPPSINGAILLGSGSDHLDIQGGTVAGDISFGAGANSLSISGGATVAGGLTAEGGTVGLAVADGSLQINSVGTVNLTSLNLGSASTLIVTADPAAGAATKLDVAGDAVIAGGAKIGVRLTSLLHGEATYTLVRADRLVASTIDTSLLGSVPYLYASSLKADPAAGTVSLTLARKTAEELQLPVVSSAAYEPWIQAIERDPGLRDALLGQTDRAGLVGLYNQMLPNRSGSVFRMAAATAEAFGKPLDDRQDPAGGGGWVQELNYGLVADGADGSPGYKGWGLGFVSGYERGAHPLGVVGVTFGASSSQIYDDGAAPSENLTAQVVEAGAYWRATLDGFSANARVAGDYLRVSSTRAVYAVDADGVGVSRSATAHWSGGGLTGRLMASYEAHLGPAYLRPQARMDYFRLSEGGYQEQGGGDAMNLAVSRRDSSSLSGFAGVALGAVFGEENNWQPELLLGWRKVVSETVGDTTARFVSGGDPFTLTADQIGGQGPSAHISFRGENPAGGLAVETGAEMRGGLAIYDLRLTAHFTF